MSLERSKKPRVQVQHEHRSVGSLTRLGINGRGQGLGVETFVSQYKSNGSSLTIDSKIVADLWTHRCKRGYQRP